MSDATSYRANTDRGFFCFWGLLMLSSESTTVVSFRALYRPTFKNILTCRNDRSGRYWEQLKIPKSEVYLLWNHSFRISNEIVESPLIF